MHSIPVSLANSILLLIPVETRRISASKVFPLFKFKEVNFPSLAIISAHSSDVMNVIPQSETWFLKVSTLLKI